MKKAVLHFLIVFAFLVGSKNLMAQDATLVVSVTYGSGGPSIGATVFVLQNNSQIAVGVTNVKGEATITPLTPGKYDLKVSYVGQSKEIEGIKLVEGINRRDVRIGDKLICCIRCFPITPPLQSVYGETAGVMVGSALDQLLTNNWFRNE
ncbi:MAG: carboxypeptidase regulatory-like domain-containing protein [Bacteroidetes bacterium]|nr:carboxypeptidase regulatory-like domain-containing protein [Bacteroidota bacterium]